MALGRVKHHRVKRRKGDGIRNERTCAPGVEGERKVVDKEVKSREAER